MAKRRIVLASSSPRRRQLMNEVGMEFEVITSQTEEFVEAEENASHLVVRLAELKARDVAGRVSECTVIGCQNAWNVVRQNTHGVHGSVCYQR